MPQNSLVLNTGKTKELIVDRRKKAPPTSPAYQRAEVQRVDSLKVLVLHIPSAGPNTAATLTTAQQRLHFTRSLEPVGPAGSPPRPAEVWLVLRGLTVWYCPTVEEEKPVQRIIKTAQKILGAQLPSTDSLYTNHCRN